MRRATAIYQGVAKAAQRHHGACRPSIRTYIRTYIEPARIFTIMTPGIPGHDSKTKE
jgi:hypothetical protein